jgi:hypothetical protein
MELVTLDTPPYQVSLKIFGGYPVPAGELYTFGNGLTDTANTITLGGTLSANVVFTGASYSVTIPNLIISNAPSGDNTNTSLLARDPSTGAIETKTVASIGVDLGISGVNTGDQTITLTGDVTGSGTGSFATTISAGSVDIPMLSATGTPSNTTYLRGDGQWVVPPDTVGFTLPNATTWSEITGTNYLTFSNTGGVRIGGSTSYTGAAPSIDIEGYISNNNIGGTLRVKAGSGNTNGGNLDIYGGNGGTGNGGDIVVVGGGAGSTGGSTGGDVTIEGGAGLGEIGGNVYLRGGQGGMGGTDGFIVLLSLPTSSAGLPSGALWNDTGTLKIA